MTATGQRDGACPVCRARYRATPQCPRCGADLSGLMRLSARAWQLRREAREAIMEGDYRRALDHANHACRLHRTAAGARLLTLCRILAG